MPWQEESVMSQRLRLVEQLLLPGAKVKAICERFGITPKTAYKWLGRFKAGGPDALRDQSRQPHHQPNKSSEAVEALIIATHNAFPYWGPSKLRAYLLNTQGVNDLPSHTTIGNILKRNACKVVRTHQSKPATRRFERTRPNELWQMDFKGSFMMAYARCYPLTILDDHSRYSIKLAACKDEKRMTVKAQLIAAFKEFGLPEQINTDNGNPWGASDLNSYTSLMVWLMKLGVRLTHSSPHHPQTNGKCERFHRTLKLEVLHQRTYKSLRETQAAFTSWRHIYNYKRPHQALGGKPPSSCYRRSYRELPERLPQPHYESGDVVRKVHGHSGMFRFKGKRYRAGKALANEYIAIRETHVDGEYAIYFMETLIKKFRQYEAV